MRNLRKDTPFTPKMKCIHSHAVCSYLENLMQLISIQSFKKVKHQWSTKIVVHMFCALYESLLNQSKALFEERTEISLFPENVPPALEYLNWSAVLDCNTCKKMALGFNDVSFSMCAQKQFWMLQKWGRFLVCKRACFKRLGIYGLIL